MEMMTESHTNAQVALLAAATYWSRDPRLPDNRVDQTAMAFLNWLDRCDIDEARRATEEIDEELITAQPAQVLVHMVPIADDGRTWCGINVNRDLAPGMEIRYTSYWLGVTCPDCRERRKGLHHG